MRGKIIVIEGTDCSGKDNSLVVIAKNIESI